MLLDVQERAAIYANNNVWLPIKIHNSVCIITPPMLEQVDELSSCVRVATFSRLLLTTQPVHFFPQSMNQ